MQQLQMERQKEYSEEEPGPPAEWFPETEAKKNGWFPAGGSSKQLQSRA